MVQVEIFIGYPEEIKNKINDWLLSKGDTISIEKIKQNKFFNYNSQRKDIKLIICIFYKLNKSL